MSTTVDTSHADVISIRPAVLSDADRVFGLLQQLQWLGYAPDKTAFDSSFGVLVGEDQYSLLLVAENDSSAMLGYALTTISPLLHIYGGSAQLQELVVEDAHRGTGVGTALVEAVEAICRARDVRELTVPSRRSADFYERLGYRSTADLLKRSFD